MATSELSPDEVEEFREAVVRGLGLVFEEHRLPDLTATLSDRMAETGCQRFRAYMERLASAKTSRQEWRTLAERLTVGETFFFRNANQYKALLEVALPELKRAVRPREEVRILSAGCAGGEEPYSIAILLHDLRKELATVETTIFAVDVHPNSLKRARAAIYSSWSLRGMPQQQRERFFKQKDQGWVLNEEIRSMVRFEELNLVDPEPDFWSAGRFDVVFCRNVLMYFSQQQARAVVGRITRALIPGGYLFLGHAETLRGLSLEFHLVHSHDTFYYRRRLPGEKETGERVEGISGAPPSLKSEVKVTTGGQGPAEPALPDASWYEEIQQAHQRIAALAQGAAPEHRLEADQATPRESEGEAGGRSSELKVVRKALEEERFSEAMEILGQLPQEAGNDPEALLLRAAVLTNRAELDSAKDILKWLLALDQFNPGAHYLMGLCCQQNGETKKAIDHYRSATYLDPNFAMPHFQLGRLASLGRDLQTARREFRQALELLYREDAARVLLFGGGFNRSALLALCRAELRRTGGEA